MKRVLLCLLPLTLGACNPFPKDEGDSSEPRTKANAPAAAKATTTPKPTPAPGAWMTDKTRENPLDHKSHK